MTIRFQHGRLAEIRKDLLAACEEDHVALWKIIWHLRNAFGQNLSEEIVRDTTLQIVAEFLSSGKVQPGWPTAKGGWERWDLSPKAVLARIEAEWDALEKEPALPRLILDR